MRTEEEFLTQLVAGAIPCPCEHRCISKPPNIPDAFKRMPIRWEHESYKAYMTCLTIYVQSEVFEALKGLRARGGKSAGYPQDGYVLLEKKAEPKVFERPIKELKVHFADTITELDKIITHRLFMICEIATEELYRS